MNKRTLSRVALLLSTLLWGGCGNMLGVGGKGLDAADAGLEGKWMMQSMTVAGAQVAVVGPSPVTIEFAGKKYSGDGGCNSYGGVFVATASGELQLTEGAWTEMACLDDVQMKQETDYAQLLAQVQSYSANKDQLVLSDGTTDNQIVFVPYQAPPALPFKGTTWQLTTFESVSGVGDEATDSAEPVLNQAPITLLIKDELASGSSGCNEYTAMCMMADGTVRFENWSLTEKACEPDVLRQEQRFVEVMREMTRYSISGDHLRLSNDDQTLSLHFSGQP